MCAECRDADRPERRAAIRYWLSVGAQPSEKVQALLEQVRREEARAGRALAGCRSRIAAAAAPASPAAGRSRRSRVSAASSRTKMDVAAMAARRRYRIDVLTLFPGLFDGFLSQSILSRAIDKGLVEIERWDIRDWAEGKHKQVDDRPFGGGPGMVLMAPPVVAAAEAVRAAGRAARDV